MKVLGFKVSWLIIVHILLGIISVYSSIPAIVWGLSVIVYCIYKSGDKNGLVISIFLAFLTSFELFARLVKTAPFLPYEIGKYGSIAIALVYLLNGRVKNYNRVAVALLMLSIPSLLSLDMSTGEYRNTLVFNYFGFVSMVLLMMVFDNRTFSIEIDFKNILTAFLLPVISILVFLTLKTSNLSDMEFELGANYQSTAGFGPNQVATIMGIGLFIAYIYYVLYGKMAFGIGMFAVDSLVITFACLLRGLLTFSRGGMLVGFVLLFIFIGLQGPISRKIKMFKLSILQVLFLIFFLFAATYKINEFTDNQLWLRYQGETKGTQNMDREKDVNLLLSGRKSIIEEELELFYDNPFLGVGPGQSRFERIKRGYEDNNSHTEVARMLAEHGVFGIIMALIFIFYPFYLIKRQKELLGKFIVGAFSFIAIVTSFHSATRLLITPFFYGLACSNFNFNKK